MNLFDKIERGLAKVFRIPRMDHNIYESWKSYDMMLRATHPVFFFLIEALYNIDCSATYYWTWLKDHTYWYIVYRTTDKYHVISTGLEPGYRDSDTRMLHANFNLLKEFVEHELAWMQELSEAYDEREQVKSWCWKTKLLYYLHEGGRKSWKPNREQGLKYLDWKETLVNDGSYGFSKDDSEYGKPSIWAENAKEIRALYLWWVDDFMNRKDPHDWKKEYSSDGYFSKVPGGVLDNIIALENKYEKEEEEMLIRLMKIRKTLWT